jgi:GNAT superfamily N-acetyltransferase
MNRTYYILHPVSQPNVICACGGWSFRKTLYGGDSAPSPLRMPAKRNPATDRASIRAIFTSPAYARQGLGTMMMRYCEARAAEGKDGEVEGFTRLEMGATLSGVSLYEKCGYMRSGREDRVECPNGEGIRVVHMTKDLDEVGKGGVGV